MSVTYEVNRPSCKRTLSIVDDNGVPIVCCMIRIRTLFRVHSADNHSK